MSYPLLTSDWWKAAAVRAVRTALVIALPYVAASATGALPYLTVAAAVGMGVVLSFLTSLAGLAELQPNKQNYYIAILTRVAKTVAQALVTAIGTTVLITEVDWTAIGALALSSGLGSLLLGLLSVLPEAEQPAVVTTTTITDGQVEQTQIPVVGVVNVSNDESANN